VKGRAKQKSTGVHLAADKKKGEKKNRNGWNLVSSNLRRKETKTK